MKNMKEIWRDIPDYEGYYQASNLGRVRSLDRWVIFKNGRKQFYKGRIFEGGKVNGYRQVGLSRDGKTTIFLIHQLVAMAFLGHKPDGHQLVIDHINGIRSDNRVENLQIVTNRENSSTCYREDKDSLTSEYVGVCYSKQTDKWQAHIHSNYQIIYLGLFDSEINASNAYQKALAELENGTFNPENYRVKWTSKYKGVSYYKNTKKWVATQYINGNRIHLGYFATELEAHQAILEYQAIQPI